MSDNVKEISRSQMFIHEDFVEWATEEGLLTGKESQAETIAVFAARRNAYRATERYTELRETHKAEADERKAAAKAAAAEKRAAAKAEKEAEKEKAAKKAPAKKTAAKKTAAKKSSASSDEDVFD